MNKALFIAFIFIVKNHDCIPLSENPINQLNNYGCWCHSAKKDLKGQPVDQIDQFCKELSECLLCTDRESGCNTYSDAPVSDFQDFELPNLFSNTLYTNIEGLNDKRYKFLKQCQEINLIGDKSGGSNSCKAKSCQCYSQFLEKMIGSKIDSNIKLQPEFQNFDPSSETCLTSYSNNPKSKQTSLTCPKGEIPFYQVPIMELDCKDFKPKKSLNNFKPTKFQIEPSDRCWLDNYSKKIDSHARNFVYMSLSVYKKSKITNFFEENSDYLMRNLDNEDERLTKKEKRKLQKLKTQKQETCDSEVGFIYDKHHKQLKTILVQGTKAKNLCVTLLNKFETNNSNNTSKNNNNRPTNNNEQKVSIRQCKNGDHSQQFYLDQNTGHLLFNGKSWCLSVRDAKKAKRSYLRGQKMADGVKCLRFKAIAERCQA